MTNKQATEILRRKYPNASIHRPSEKCGYCKKGSIAVMFEPNGKVYSYMANNYANVLERLGCIREGEEAGI